MNELYRRRDAAQKELNEAQKEIDQINSQGETKWNTPPKDSSDYELFYKYQ